MKKFLNIFFVTLGVIFLFQIIFMVYFYVADPLNLKPLLFGEDEVDAAISATTESESSADGVIDKNPMLNENQEAVLESVGINPANLPSEVTPEQESCMIEAVGAARAEEIKAGATPTAVEIFKARGCL